MATVPTRRSSFSVAFNSIINQVDCLYLYLDGHSEVPEPARNNPRVVPILSTELPGLASDGKFAGIYREMVPALYLGLDDDIEYPPEYVFTLRAQLEARGGRAVVGYHGSLLHTPFRSYCYDRTVYSFGSALDNSRQVDVLSTGTVMFDLAELRFDVRGWSRTGNDLHFATEAQKRGLPLVCLAHPANFLRPIEVEQTDSSFPGLKMDDSRETILAIELRRWCTGTRAEQPGAAIEIFATHGVVEGCRADRFEHVNLLDLARFTEFLRSADKFVPLSAAREGRGKALTIDDATVASGRAAMLAREFGHAVTLFINPWEIESARPYPASRMDGLLDRINVDNFFWNGREFHLNCFEGKLAFRMYFKQATRRHTTPEETGTLIEDIERALGVDWNNIPSHMNCLRLGDIQRLRDNGVQIENHYWTHLDPAAHSAAQFSEDFFKARHWLSNLFGINSKYFASPFGEFLPPAELLKESGTTCVLLHNELSSGVVEDAIVNRITLTL